MGDISKHNIFSLPEDILAKLELREEYSVEEKTDSANLSNQGDIVDSTQKNISSCVNCQIDNLHTLDERKSHIKSDWHRFNTKRKITKLPPVSQDEFESIIEDLPESLSGSESETNSESEEDNFQIEKAFKQSLNIGKVDSADENNNQRTNSPLTWFQLSNASAEVPTYIGVYKHMFSGNNHITKDLLVQQQNHNRQKPLQLAMFMVGGGHFAAMIASNEFNPRDPHVPKVLAQKTIHRYTTRRKQGGSQGAADNTKGNIHSAGSGLRRYNEQALIKDIQQVFKDWGKLLETCDLIFVRAIGSSNRSIFFSQPGALISPKDPKLRVFPFTTKRATHSELLRCYKELVTPKISHVDSISIKAQEEERKRQAEIEKEIRQSRLQEEERKKKKLAKYTEVIISNLKASNIEAFLEYLRSNDLSINFQFYPKNVHLHTSTPLHYAVTQKNAKLVAKLLRNGADPAMLNGNGKTPFEISTGNKEVKDEFLIARHELGESFFDWEAAKVGAPQSREQIQKQRQKAKTKLENQRRDKERQEELRRKEAMQKIEEQSKRDYDKLHGEGHSLGINNVRKVDELQSLSPEMRMRIEREKRAAAAMKRMQTK
ncbi:Cdc48p-Npl4p-Vms1p AAA ATPase complex subunit involved in ER associated ubiquitin-dependent protein catabolic process Vms1 [Schizosaccharomyces pombe]|uniref:tRNA endonuclease vms1 n=1 Tax=Schizosaccharomyces pombe (strain 972 / ATCC 24843) TaxID=284812 RepID=VMS1_SCHPO|nr:ankyrin-repeat protein [Schizosaccharomyces pombe]O74977.1 RecName: Full=tRNA endonuclease vms1 [Schizosaccharomyces pombe 972h-]CAA19312.1 ankyrin repeat protein, unknown biological role [Schizosaccharomyces pombe]|eukprot:NP_001342733.1 ankyrin-repeat protein [Schizosaccharomyces pombe]